MNTRDIVKQVVVVGLVPLVLALVAPVLRAGPRPGPMSAFYERGQTVLDFVLDRARFTSHESEWHRYARSARNAATQEWKRVARELGISDVPIEELNERLNEYVEERFARLYGEGLRSDAAPDPVSRLLGAIDASRVDQAEPGTRQWEEAVVETVLSGSGHSEVALERELEAILELESRRRRMHRLRDRSSLRQETEEDHAQFVAADLIEEVESRLSAEVTATPFAHPVDEAARLARGEDIPDRIEGFREQFDRGLRRWTLAEEQLLSERVLWEQESGDRFSADSRMWRRALSQLDDARSRWSDEMLHLAQENLDARHSERDELARYLADAMNESEQQLLRRREAENERVEATRTRFLVAHDTMRLARESSDYWASRIESSDTEDDDAAAEAAYWTEIYRARRADAVEARDALQTDVGVEHDPLAYELSRARENLSFFYSERAVAEAVHEYAHDESSGREGGSQTEHNLSVAGSLYREARDAIDEHRRDIGDRVARLHDLGDRIAAEIDAVQEAEADLAAARDAYEETLNNSEDGAVSYLLARQQETIDELTRLRAPGSIETLLGELAEAEYGYLRTREQAAAAEAVAGLSGIPEPDIETIVALGLLQADSPFQWFASLEDDGIGHAGELTALYRTDSLERLFSSAENLRVADEIAVIERQLRVELAAFGQLDERVSHDLSLDASEQRDAQELAGFFRERTDPGADDAGDPGVDDAGDPGAEEPGVDDAGAGDPGADDAGDPGADAAPGDEAIVGHDGAAGPETAVVEKAAGVAQLLDAVAGEPVARIDSLAELDSALHTAALETPYLFRLLQGNSYFADKQGDLSETRAYAAVPAIRRSRAMHRALVEYGEVSPAVQALRHDAARRRVVSALGEGGLLAGRSGPAQVHLEVSPETNAFVSSASLRELAEWKVDLSARMDSARATLGNTAVDRVIEWIESLVDAQHLRLLDSFDPDEETVAAYREAAERAAARAAENGQLDPGARADSGASAHSGDSGEPAATFGDPAELVGDEGVDRHRLHREAWIRDAQYRDVLRLRELRIRREESIFPYRAYVDGESIDWADPSSSRPEPVEPGEVRSWGEAEREAGRSRTGGARVSAESALRRVATADRPDVAALEQSAGALDRAETAFREAREHERELERRIVALGGRITEVHKLASDGFDERLSDRGDVVRARRRERDEVVERWDDLLAEYESLEALYNRDLQRLDVLEANSSAAHLQKRRAEAIHSYAVNEYMTPTDIDEKLADARSSFEEAEALVDRLERAEQVSGIAARERSAGEGSATARYQASFDEYERQLSDATSIRALKALLSQAHDDEFQRYARAEREREELLAEIVAWDNSAGDDADDREAFENDAHAWVTDVAEWIDATGADQFGDWGLALYFEELSIARAVEVFFDPIPDDRQIEQRRLDLYGRTDDDTGERTPAPTAPSFRDFREAELRPWTDARDTLVEFDAVDRDRALEELAEAVNAGEFDSVHDRARARAEEPSRMVSSGMYNALQRGGLFRTPIDGDSHLYTIAAEAYARVRASGTAAELFENYVDLHRRGAIRADHGLFELPGVVPPAEFVGYAEQAASSRLDNAEKWQKRHTVAAASLYGAAIASWWAPPLAASLFAAAAVETAVAVSAGSAARHYRELGRDLSSIDRASALTRAVEQSVSDIGAYSAHVDQLLATQEALSSLSGGADSGIAGQIAELSRSLDDDTGRILGLDESVHEFLERIAGTSGEGGGVTEYRDLNSLLDGASATAEASLRTAGTELDRRAEQLAAQPDDEFEVTTFSLARHYHQRASVETGIYDRFDTIGRPELAFFETETVDAFLTAGAAIDRVEENLRRRHRAAEFSTMLDRFDEETARVQQELGTLRERGERAWDRSAQRLHARHNSWITRREQDFARRSSLWDEQYESLQAERNSWIGSVLTAIDRGGHGARPVDIARRAHESAGAYDGIYISPAASSERSASQIVADVLEESSFVDVLDNARRIAVARPGSYADGVSFSSRRSVVGSDVLRAIRDSRRDDIDQVRTAVARIRADQTQHELDNLVAEYESGVESANERVDNLVSRTFLESGYRRLGSRFERDTVVADTVGGTVRDHHTIRSFRRFDDYDFSFNAAVSPAGLDGLGSDRLLIRLERAREQLQREWEAVFGAHSESDGYIDTDAKTEIEIELDRGVVAEWLDVGDASTTLVRRSDPRFQAGRFGRHVGYAPELMPNVDRSTSWRRNLAFDGRGEMHTLMGRYLYFEALQNRGYEELQSGFHNKRLWDGTNAPTIRGVSEIGAGIAAGFLSGGMSTAAMVGNSAFFGALDVLSQDAGVEEMMLATGRSIAAAGVGYLAGFGGNVVADQLGGGIAGETAGALSEALTGNLGTGLLSAVGTGGFGSEDLLSSVFGDRALAGYLGDGLGRAVAGDLTGFSPDDSASVLEVSGLVGSGAQAGLEYALTGGTSLTVLDFRDIARIGGIDGFRRHDESGRSIPGSWNSAGLLTLEFGDGDPSLLAGGGGIDASPSRLAAAAGGLGTYHQQLRIGAYDLLGRADISSSYDGARNAGTALRGLYSYADSVGSEAYRSILSGETVLRVGYASDFPDTDSFRGRTGRVEGERAIMLASLGDTGHGERAVSSRLLGALTLQHEAYRDGRAPIAADRSFESDALVENRRETVRAVLGRTRMAERMTQDYAGVAELDRLTDNEVRLLRLASQQGRPEAFEEYVSVAYRHDDDFFFVPVTTGGSYQNVAENFEQALLAAPTRDEVNRINRQAMDDAYREYLNDDSESSYLNRWEFEREVDANDEFGRYYGYDSSPFISIGEYGCVLYSVGYMLESATGINHSALAINEAIAQNGHHTHGTLMSVDNIEDAMNSLAPDGFRFEHAEQHFAPSHQVLLDAHEADNEYLGYVRVAHPDFVGADGRGSEGVHSEVIHGIDVFWDPLSDGWMVDRVRTANPWQSGGYYGRTERAPAELSRLDLFEVHRDYLTWAMNDLNASLDASTIARR